MNNIDLRRIRKALDMTGKELSAAIGLSLSSLEKYEAGTREIPLKVQLAVETIVNRGK